VADELDISNGHAARMRYSRFKQQMEGIGPLSRTAKPKKSAAGKGESSKGNRSSSSSSSTKSSKAGVSSSSSSSSRTGTDNTERMTPPPAYSRKRKASEELIDREPADPISPAANRVTMQSSMLPGYFQSRQHGLPGTGSMSMASNGLMSAAHDLPEDLCAAPMDYTPYLTTPYALPLESPSQLAMNSDRVSYTAVNSQSYGYGSGHTENVNPASSLPQQQHGFCFSGCCQQPMYPLIPSLYPGYQASSSVPPSTPLAGPVANVQYLPQAIHPQLQLPQSQDLWVPIREEDSDDVLVKIESTDTESTMA